MKVKRILVAALLLVMAFSIVGCHKKDETAVTIGDVKFTSAYYMCALINADSEAKSKVQETLTDEEKNSSDIDYYSKKIEKKKYVTWVEDTAMESLKKIAAYKTLCKKAKLELKDEVKTNAENYASYYWSNYGYSAYFEPNGVGAATYTSYMTDSYYSNLYFEHLYGEDGEKAIDAETVKSAIFDNFVIADKLEASFSEKTDEEKATLKEQFNGYLKALQDKTKTFEDVYKEYNGTTDEATAEDTNSEEPQPADKYATILGAADTVYESDDYDTVKAMATDEVKLIEKENDAGLVLVVKKDIQADSYYIDNLDLSARHLLKDDEFDKYIEEYMKDLKVDTNNYAVKQFKVKKIKEPETSQS